MAKKVTKRAVRTPRTSQAPARRKKVAGVMTMKSKTPFFARMMEKGRSWIERAKKFQMKESHG